MQPFIQFRLTVAAALLWVAYKIAPIELSMIIEGLLQGASGLRGEIEKGRTFGVLTAIWAHDEEGFEKASQMQAAARRALFWERKKVERGFPAFNGGPCSEIVLPESGHCTLGFGIDL